MQHKSMVLFTILTLLSLLSAPLGEVHAQDTAPGCPPYQPGLLQDRGFLDSLPEECILGYKELARQANPPHKEEAVESGTKLNTGPDGFGYTLHDAYPYNWISAATNSGLSGDDTFTGPLDLGFTFPFYGLTHTQVYFNTNGLMTFGGGSPDWGDSGIGDESNPNNLIAPFWADLLVGGPYNSGGVYYSRGGSAPNRYFVVEWRGVELYYHTGTFTFQAILHESGDIVFQYASLPSDYFVTVGLEDSIGYDGLEYLYGTNGLFAFNAIRFDYPTTPTARLLAYAPQAGGFVPLNGYKDFPIRVTNTGTAGTDTYNIFELSSSDWSHSFYAADGVTLLTDTNGDNYRDTGPVAQMASTTILVRYRPPANAQIGDSAGSELMVESSRSAYAGKRLNLSMAIPAGFAQVFQDPADGAMSFLTASPAGSDQYKATANNYAGSHLALVQLPNGNYFYTWDKGAQGVSGFVRNIEYALLNGAGQVVRLPARLTDNTSATIYAADSFPAVAVAPNGTVGVLWTRYLYNRTTGYSNSNLYFATLNSAGTRRTGPTNITNNAVWGVNLIEFELPTIAATSDNRFLMSWVKYQRVNNYAANDVWYAVRNADGASVLAPTALTTDGWGFEPVLNPLAGGRAILTWQTGEGSRYAVLNSSGGFVKPATPIGAYGTSSIDAVQLSNGKVALAWVDGGSAWLVMLNSFYSMEGGPVYSQTPFPYITGDHLSVTTDAANRVIMTWAGEYRHTKQLYAMADSTGTFITSPVVYGSSRDFIDVSWIGQGNAPYVPAPIISGNAGVAGASLTYTGGSATADGSGNYSFKVPRGWSGTVTPSKSGYIFSPVSRTYSNVTTNQAAQDYLATPLYSISGNVGVAGVTLSYTYETPKTVTSQPDGSYSLSVPMGWSGTVTPAHPCFTFNPLNRSYTSLSGNHTAQNHTPSFNLGAGCADIDVQIGGTNQGRFGLESGASTRASFSGVNNGPVKIVSTNNVPLIGAERLIYKFGGVNTSFTEMMGLPDNQLDNSYWLPWYNNVDLDTQLRFANVSNSPATVTITIGAQQMGDPIQLAAGASTRVSFAGVNNGPVKIVSTQNIVAAERLIYKVAGKNTSFSEMMALPNSQLDSTYWLPWYNNVDLDTQLRFANVHDTETAQVHVYIGGVEMPNSPFTLQPGESTRQSFAGVNNGPVQIVSNVNIVAAERLIYKVNGKNTSFTEMMALPNTKLDTTYWLPWYNNADLDTQLRFANVHDTQTATVHVYIGGVEMPNSPFTLLPGESTRQSFAGINSGPVQIVSNVPIVAAERLIYKVNNINTSFSEMMALPDSLLDSIYWLPWYNNADLDTQLRFGVP